MGMTNMAATIPGFVVPALVGNLTHGVVSFISISYELKFFLIRRGLLRKLPCQIFSAFFFHCYLILSLPVHIE